MTLLIAQICNFLQIHKLAYFLTWNSITAFEFASYGIPSFFLFDEVITNGKSIFYDQYYYPLYAGLSVKRCRFSYVWKRI